MNKNFLGAAALAAITLAATFAAPLQADDFDYRYCSASLRSDNGSMTYVYSTVFRVESGTYHVGIQNSYTSRIQAEYSGWDGTICMGPYDSWQEAEDSRNDDMASSRDRLGFAVHSLQWAYYGD